MYAATDDADGHTVYVTPAIRPEPEAGLIRLVDLRTGRGMRARNGELHLDAGEDGQAIEGLDIRPDREWILQANRLMRRIWPDWRIDDGSEPGPDGILPLSLRRDH